ncbi:MAG TPA: hypothetical protein VKU41_09905 [Polyangiaceae bacterium]|nr:hypothetical protein [Polyangiaceae bacterium]
MSKRAIAAALAVVSALAACSRPAGAQAPPPAERAGIYSAYENETIDLVLAGLHAKRDMNPEGKTIERVDVVPLDVLEERDPLPRWTKNALNALHYTTRKGVIRQEILLSEGEPYRQILVDDTIRNLRRLAQLSLVLIVATEGSAPDRVGLVVITKDVWSLRLAWNVIGTPGGLEALEFQPSEQNFLGTHQTLFGHFLLEPSAYTLGLGYQVPRLGGSRVAMVGEADVMVNRASGQPEGSYGSLIAGQPLYSGIAKWSWDSNVAWQDVITRRYGNARLVYFRDAATPADVPCPSPLCIPFQYKTQQFLAQYQATRSLGWETKHDLSIGVSLARNAYSTNLPGADPTTVATFKGKFVPLSDTEVGPYVQYHTYSKRYIRVIDFETLALQEDYHLGHDLTLKVEPSPRFFGSTRDVLLVYAAAQYTVGVRDGLFRASIATQTDPQVDRIADASVTPSAHLVSPSIAGIGRVVVDGTMTYRYRNYLNIIDYLGGSDRLRGYPTSFFAGKDVVSYNVELRSRPWEILSCQLAGTLFYDAGDAFYGLGQFQAFQSIGVGFRALFPQLDRIVFRADLGFPIERPLDPTGRPIAPYGFVITFGQAFDVPSTAPTPILPTGESETSTD